MKASKQIRKQGINQERERNLRPIQAHINSLGLYVTVPLEIRLFYPQLCSRGSRERRSQSNRWSLWQASDYEGNLAVFSVHQYLLQFNRRGVWLLYTHIEKANSLEPAWTHMWRIRVNFINENFDDDDFFCMTKHGEKNQKHIFEGKNFEEMCFVLLFFHRRDGSGLKCSWCAVGYSKKCKTFSANCSSSLSVNM